ncbi:alpha-amylase A type-3 [Trichoderma asperellum]|uniref:Alpha-amylase n=1 Tax=Trichoderma asperellum TaxID=101201 RepID=A0A6V8QKB3_TRIAP|nr:glycoside hydrolase family 13 protein [Trichoderma asperelloides]GFP52917.1 alpha-amylase A type-3 [Trichoderma asperellum]
MKLRSAVPLLLQISLPAVLGADTADWKSRTIYFALTDRIARSSSDTGGDACSNLNDYCGGTFQGLESKLDYIKGMGFDAIWITPVVTNSDFGYHGYWAQDINSINSHYGSSDDLKSLVDAAHSKGFYMMVDVVANHMGNANITDDSPSPLNQDSSYHTKCDIDFNNQTSVENCWLAGLPDLDTQSPTIRSLYQDWVSNLVSTYGFDGVRIDTVRHVEQDYWPGFVNATGVYCIGEVFNGDPDFMQPYQSLMPGLLNYAIFYPLNAFYQQTGSSQSLVDTHDRLSSFPDPTALGTFVDNHDNPRFLSIKNDTSLFKNALTYTILGRGIPIVYYGSEQAFSGSNDPANREDLWRSGYNTETDMYNAISKLTFAKHTAGGLADNDHKHLYVEPTAYAWSRAGGKLVAFTTNSGSGSSAQFCFGTQVPNGSWQNVFDSGNGPTYTADGNGQLCLNTTNGEPIVLLSS